MISAFASSGTFSTFARSKRLDLDVLPDELLLEHLESAAS